ncbi:hypothetical protein BpHYR1_025067 [Brachionus plicatilis]|uniref:Uncharacterized protein n=1 Tax=Brachionus plicatilis TaxID=10195 RepID=A0A3M7SE79_BRAPC|nr:hypothetical protein BpHYR1_025067 [Brachionus plicatilis]
MKTIHKDPLLFKAMHSPWVEQKKNFTFNLTQDQLFTQFTILKQKKKNKTFAFKLLTKLEPKKHLKRLKKGISFSTSTCCSIP